MDYTVHFAKAHINNLSLEILSQIFDQYIWEESQRVADELTIKSTTKHAFKFKLLNVCRLWREILLRGTQFWSHIVIEYGVAIESSREPWRYDKRDITRICDLLEKRLHAAGSRPIFLSLSDYSTLASDIRRQDGNCLDAILEVLKQRQPSFQHYFEDSTETPGIFGHLHRSLPQENFRKLITLNIQSIPEKGTSSTSAWQWRDPYYSMGCNIDLPCLQVLELQAYSDPSDVLSILSAEKLHTLICVTIQIVSINPVRFFSCLQSFPALRHLDAGCDSDLTPEEKSQIIPHLKVERLVDPDNALMEYVGIAFPNLTSLMLVGVHHFDFFLDLPDEKYLFKLLEISLTMCNCEDREEEEEMLSDELPSKQEVDFWGQMVPYFDNLRDLRFSASKKDDQEDLPYQNIVLQTYYSPWTEGMAVCPRLSEAISSSLLEIDVITHDENHAEMYFPRLEHVRISGKITGVCFCQLLDAMKIRSEHSLIASCRVTFWNLEVEVGERKEAQRYPIADVNRASYDEIIERQDVLELLERLMVEKSKVDGEDGSSAVDPGAHH